jgi:hypothetical protein
LLANKGEALLGLKRHGGWKSSSTAEGCIEMCNQEDKENSGYESFDNANVVASPLISFHCSGKKGQLQELCKFSESANILSSTSVYIKIIAYRSRTLKLLTVLETDVLKKQIKYNRPKRMSLLRSPQMSFLLHHLTFERYKLKKLLNIFWRNIVSIIDTEIQFNQI